MDLSIFAIFVSDMFGISFCCPFLRLVVSVSGNGPIWFVGDCYCQFHKWSPRTHSGLRITGYRHWYEDYHSLLVNLSTGHDTLSAQRFCEHGCPNHVFITFVNLEIQKTFLCRTVSCITALQVFDDLLFGAAVVTTFAWALQWPIKTRVLVRCHLLVLRLEAASFMLALDSAMATGLLVFGYIGVLGGEAASVMLAFDYAMFTGLLV